MISRRTSSRALLALLTLLCCLSGTPWTHAYEGPPRLKPRAEQQNQVAPTPPVPPATESIPDQPAAEPQENLLNPISADAAPLFESPIWQAVALVALMLVVIGAVMALRRWLATR